MRRIDTLYALFASVRFSASVNRRDARAPSLRADGETLKGENAEGGSNLRLSSERVSHRGGRKRSRPRAREFIEKTRDVSARSSTTSIRNEIMNIENGEIQQNIER